MNESLNAEIHELKALSAGIFLLYVEDNTGLRENIEQLLKKIFPNVLIAEDGAAGYEMFRRHKPRVVLTDINMPKMTGVEMARKIKADEPDTKIIYITAYDDKEHLLDAINVGVFRYLPKPAKVNQLIDALYDAVKAIRYEEHKHIFENQLKDIFNYQNNLLIMFDIAKPVIVNQRFLDFFGVENLEGFMNKYETFNMLLKPHEGFLYSNENATWFEKASENPGKLYHTKMLNHDGESRHLIMKLREIPGKEGAAIVSFDDVTELNLLGLFDKNAAESDKAMQDRKTVLKFLKIVSENNADVKLHNFYRGLTITNPAVILHIDEDHVTVKTSHSQLKIVKLVKSMTISSEVFPSAVLCKAVKDVDFEKQTITFSEMQFIQRSGNDRINIRLEPEENHKVTLFFEGKKFFGEIRIVDISIISVKLELNALPPGIVINQVVSISMVLPTAGAPLNLNTPATIFRIDEHKRHFDIVLMYELSGLMHKGLLEYLAARQIALIREYKSLAVE